MNTSQLFMTNDKPHNLVADYIYGKWITGDQNTFQIKEDLHFFPLLKFINFFIKTHGGYVKLQSLIKCPRRMINTQSMLDWSEIPVKTYSQKMKKVKIANQRKINFSRYLKVFYNPLKIISGK